MIHIDCKFYQYLKNNISKKVWGNDILLVIYFKNACLYRVIFTLKMLAYIKSKAT